MSRKNPKRISLKSYKNQKRRKNLLRSRKKHLRNHINLQLRQSPLRLLRKTKRWLKKKKMMMRTKKRMKMMRLPEEELKEIRENNQNSLLLTN